MMQGVYVTTVYLYRDCLSDYIVSLSPHSQVYHFNSFQVLPTSTWSTLALTLHYMVFLPWLHQFDPLQIPVVSFVLFYF